MFNKITHSTCKETRKCDPHLRKKVVHTNQHQDDPKCCNSQRGILQHLKDLKENVWIRNEQRRSIEIIKKRTNGDSRAEKKNK